MNHLQKYVNPGKIETKQNHLSQMCKKTLTFTRKFNKNPTIPLTSNKLEIHTRNKALFQAKRVKPQFTTTLASLSNQTCSLNFHPRQLSHKDSPFKTIYKITADIKSKNH